jgi:hypothetical protein
MARVEATSELTDLEGDYRQVRGLEVTCTKCGHTVQVFGTGEASAKRGGVMLSEECPEDERNFYVVYEPGEEPDDDD